MLTAKPLLWLVRLAREHQVKTLRYLPTRYQGKQLGSLKRRVWILSQLPYASY
jgi:hypothetical protein